MSCHVHLLRLYRFRNYHDRTLTITSPRVMIAGPNGSGKTNILEALSLFTVGTGLRSAKLPSMQAQGAAEPWAVHLDFIDDMGKQHALGTALDGEALRLGRERRVIHDDHEPCLQQDLSQHLHILWHTPKMDRLFAEGTTERRRFWDRIVYGFYPDHLVHLRTFESARRERQALFDKNITSTAWHSGLEAILSEKAIAIAAARLDVLRILNTCTVTVPFRYATLSCTGWVENALLSGESALGVEGSYRQHLASLRGHYKTEGPHQSVFSAFDPEKRIDAALGSTGEQKLFVLGIQFRIAHLLAQRRSTLFLLDDITSHLDKNHCLALAHAINDAPFATWLSTINPENLGTLDAIVLHTEG